VDSHEWQQVVFEHLLVVLPPHGGVLEEEIQVPTSPRSRKAAHIMTESRCFTVLTVNLLSKQLEPVGLLTLD
jgi:hypothetical protein